MNRIHPGLKIFTAVGLSFCLGLLVFYVPERKYTSIPEVWLPTAKAANREATLSLPVKTSPDWKKGVRFLPLNPGDPEIVEVDAEQYGYKVSACPDLYDTEEESPSSCNKIGVVGGVSVY